MAPWAGHMRRALTTSTVLIVLIAALVGVIAIVLAVDWGKSAAGDGGGAIPATQPSRASAPASTSVNDAAANMEPLDEFLAIADRLENSPNPWVGQGKLPQLQAALLAGELKLGERLSAQTDLAREYLRFGQIEKALESINAAIAEAEATHALTPASMAELLRVRALVYLRQAEIENCVNRHNRDCCIFPLQGGAIHAFREPALKAKADYIRCLDLLSGTPNDAARAQRMLSIIWLLNIACMALDEYPSGVPAAYLIPPHAFESEADIGRFVDVAGELGVDVFDHAGGAVVDDFDGDGMLDIVTSTCAVRGPMKAFRSVGDGTFENVSAAWKLDQQLGGLNIVATDFNNDGRLDLYVPRGAWLFADGEIRASLLRMNEDGSFTDVTRAAGVMHPVGPSQAALWADFDNDGWLDLYVGHESQQQLDRSGKRYPCVLYRNNHDGTFTDVTTAAGVSNDHYCKGVAAGDYDNDGDIDLYVSNIGQNRLYRNNGDMTFTDVAAQAGVTQPVERSFATWFFDYDNDGWLDLWVNGYSATTADLATQALGGKHKGVRPRLYRNNRNGTFSDVTEQVGVGRAFLPMGANFGDFDNDGWLDVYLGTGDPNYEALMPNIALRNNLGMRFQDITQSSGLGHLQKGHGIAFADIDNDGDQDVFHQLGAFFPGDAFRNALFQNPGHGNHFITIELVGVQTNRMAYGARIKVVVNAPAGDREIHRAPGCVSSFGGSPRRQEIGLGDAKAIKSIEIWWPTSGQRQTFNNVAMDQFIRITEGADEIEVLQPARFELGANG